MIVARYLAGHLMTVSRRSAPRVDLEKLENIDEIWALCFRKPKPGWRLFGRFLAQDIFLGLRMYDRNELGSVENYTRLAEETVGDWDARFKGIPPLRSNNLTDYLSGEMYRDVDEPI